MAQPPMSSVQHPVVYYPVQYSYPPMSPVGSAPVQVVQPAVHAPRPTQYFPNSAYIPLQDSETPQPPPVSGACRWGSCDADVRPLGKVQDFVFSLGFGTVLPIVGPLLIHAMETTQLSRIGSLYGSGDFFLVLSIFFFHRIHSCHHAIIGAVISLLFAIIFLVAGCRKSWRYLQRYQQAVKNQDHGEVFTVVSDLGSRCQFWLGFFLSFFLPVLGTALSLLCHPTLQKRFGAVKGFAIALIVFGSIHHCALPAILLGLWLVQFSTLHFRRAFLNVDPNYNFCCSKACNRNLPANNNSGSAC